MTADLQFARGARKAGAKLARKMVPALRVPEPHEEEVKRDAYALALAMRHKPWARRYLRQYRPGRFI